MRFKVALVKDDQTSWFDKNCFHVGSEEKAHIWTNYEQFNNAMSIWTNVHGCFQKELKFVHLYQDDQGFKLVYEDDYEPL